MMRPGGVLIEAFNINNGDAGVGFEIANNAFFNIENDFVFGARSMGFNTIYQNKTYNLTFTAYSMTDQMDSHLFKWNPRGESNDCFYNGKLN